MSQASRSVLRLGGCQWTVFTGRGQVRTERAVALALVSLLGSRRSWDSLLEVKVVVGLRPV